jgi:hypothetical protein
MNRHRDSPSKKQGGRPKQGGVSISAISQIKAADIALSLINKAYR